MSYEETDVKTIVDRAVTHSWSVPEFQRGFVWKASQVRDLAESLYYNYPVGSLLLWNSSAHVEERVALDGFRPTNWIVDGQQRATALAILFGRKPYWWLAGAEWNSTLTRYDIRYDVDAAEAPFFVVANAAIRRTKSTRYIPMRDLMALDLLKKGSPDVGKLQDLARRVTEEGLCHGRDAMAVYTDLAQVCAIRDRSIVTVIVDNELEDVVEIFSRLNSRGTRVTEADIYLGVVAAKNPGWVREEFLPFISNDLEPKGFRADPNLVFRSLTAIGSSSVRFKDIPETFWEEDHIRPAWSRCKTSWGSVVSRLSVYGILSDDPLPTKAALVTLVALLDRFPAEDFAPAMYWLLQASRYGRYSGSATTTLGEDLREIRDAAGYEGALRGLCRHISLSPVSADEFLRDYGDSRFGRLMLYFMAYHNEAQDWDRSGHRLGFEAGDLLKDFRPQWHHLFPKNYLEGHYTQPQIDALANIAVIGPTINIRISDQDPMSYLDKYEISDAKLAQQLIPANRDGFALANFPEFISARAQRLADEANLRLDALRGSVSVQVVEVAPAAA
jgi:hypothetical protein